MKSNVRTLRGSLIGGAVAVLLAGLTSPSVAAPDLAAKQTAKQAAGWTASLLPIPKELPDALGYMTGTDSNGTYSGWLDDSQVVTWSGGKATLRGVPTGFEGAAANDQNGVGVVVGTTWRRDYTVNRAFTLRGNRFHLLRPPAGFTGTSAFAINTRGDIVGRAFDPVSGNPSESVVVVWKSSDPAHPVVFDIGLPEAAIQDFDDDGTILLYNLGDGDHYLWRNGALQALTVPPGFDSTIVAAIRNGSVVGSAFPYDAADARGVLWRTPDDPQILLGSARAYGINSDGLILGRKPLPSSSDGPLAVWDGTRLVAELPEPPGHRFVQADVIGDDGTIVGHANDGFTDGGPGKPAVWRYQPG